MREKIINNRQNILLGIIIVLALWNILNTNGIKTDVKSYKEKIENIQTEVDSAQLVNKEMDEKVISVGFIGNTELERLFADRYSN